jgi:hypothetical protein
MPSIPKGHLQVGVAWRKPIFPSQTFLHGINPGNSAFESTAEMTLLSVKTKIVMGKKKTKRE